MGRPKRGGAREASPGASYTNRSDLAARTPIPVFKGQPYGTLPQQQAVGQSAKTPPAQPPGSPPAQGPLFGGQHPVPPGVPAPGDFPHLFSPTQRPNEPVTAGLPFGAGPGTEALSTPTPAEDYMGQLRAIYLANPTEALRSLIEFNSNGAS